VPSKREQSPLIAPAGAELVMSLVNTHAGGSGELLGDSAGLGSWLTASGYPDEGVTDVDAAIAREPRDALAVLMLAHSGDEEASTDAVQAAESHLRRVGARYPVRVDIGVDDVRLEPVASGFVGAVAAVLGGVHTLASLNVWHRLKACRNPICHQAFFDRSRNASGIYHGTGCSTMVSMRAYRGRKKEIGDSIGQDHHD
jgi:predicted RNA-binding Zn ribbon-like protein